MKEYVINRGIKAYLNRDDRFGNFYMGLGIKRPLLREEATLNALLMNVITVSCKEFNTMRKLNIANSELYGGGIEGGCVKKGDYQLLELFGRVNGSPKNISRLFWLISEILLNPLIEGDAFKSEVVEREKKRLKESIEGIKNDKRAYAKRRFMEEMFEGEGIGLNGEGYAGDLEGITGEVLYRHYMRVISEGEIDIAVAGRFDEEWLKEELKAFDIGARDICRCFYKNTARNTIKEVNEKMSVAQGKLCMGLRAEGSYESLLVLNEMLGGGAVSRLFKNVRENKNLCYYISSGLIRSRGAFIVESGIGFDKRDDVVKEIIETADKMKNFDENEIETAKRSIVKRLYTAEDNGMGIVNFCLNGALYGGCVSIEEEIEIIKKADIRHIQRSAETLMPDTVYFLSREGNDNESGGKTVEKRNKVLYN